ncbi:MAG: dihydroorotase [Clostridium sp.]|nr:dihydroorotase [Clostridium sp.]
MQETTGSYVLRNATIHLKGGGTKLTDIFVSNGIITGIFNSGSAESPAPSTQIEEIDLMGLSVLPGLVDMHVHFREPGYEYKETIAGGAAAAIAGGFTTVCPMPNLNPSPDSEEHLDQEIEAILKLRGKIDIRPYGCITLGRKGKECVDFKKLQTYSAKKGIQLAGFSDDGSGIQEEAPMRRALEASAREGFLVAAHCEVNDLLRGGYIHDGEWCRSHYHKGICSESEWKEVERDIKIAEETGGHLHICHVSTKESVELIREAKKRGVHVSCETGPHYLVFSDEDIKDEGRFKMNPPLRTPEDRRALIEGIIDGTIDAIATDHAPHSLEEKSRGLSESAMGVVGLETSFPAVYTFMVKEGHIDMYRLIEIMSLTPRKLLGMIGAENGAMRVGNRAELTIVDLQSYQRIDPAKFSGKGRSTPFEGLILHGKVVGIRN